MARPIYEGSDVKLLIEVKAIGFNQSTDGYTIDLYNNDRKITFSQNNVITDSEGNHFLPVTKGNLNAGSLYAVVTVRIPDADFAAGYREEVVAPINLGPVLPVLK